LIRLASPFRGRPAFGLEPPLGRLNNRSRIYLGVHWRFDKTEGIKQGRLVGDYVFNNSFRKRTFGGGLTPDDDE
jgi:hypothetical protein